MIRSNLATRPFYNERAVHTWLLVIAVAAGLATAFNLSRVLYYSRSDTELERQASRDEARAADLRASATRLRASVDADQVKLASIEARQANDLIDRRMFSWTELFNRFEATLPPNVRITSVRPRADQQDRIVLAITVLAQGVEDVDQFMVNLEAAGAFSELLSRSERINDDGQLEASLETIYMPGEGARP